MNWFDSIKKYVWDERKTSFFVAVDKLRKSQAASEIFLYSLFTAIFFLVASLVLLSGAGVKEGGLVPTAVALYALILFCASIYLGLTKHPHAAVFCATAPVAAFVIILGQGLNPKLGLPDKVLLIAVTLLWLRFAVRVVAIARAYPRLGEDEDLGEDGN